MTHPKYYKHDGFEFQLVEESGNTARYIGRKGNHERHEIIGRSPNKVGSKRITFATEHQAKERFDRLTQIKDND